MGGVDLHPVKAQILCQPRRVDKARLHLGNIALAHGPGRGELPGETAERHGHGGRGQGGLPQRRRHLATGVVDLHPDLGATALGRIGPGPEALAYLWGKVWGIEHHAPRPRHGAPVHHHIAGDDEAGAPLRPGTIELDQRLGRGIVAVGHVLFHGGLGEAVDKLIAIGQGQGDKGVHGALLCSEEPTISLKLT